MLGILWELKQLSFWARSFLSVLLSVSLPLLLSGRWAFSFSVSLGSWSSRSFLCLKSLSQVWAWVSWALSFTARCWQCQGRNVDSMTTGVGPFLNYTIWPLKAWVRFSLNWNSCRRSLTIALTVTVSFNCQNDRCLVLCTCCLAPRAAVNVWTPHRDVDTAQMVISTDTL